MDWKGHIAVVALLCCASGAVQTALVHRATVPGLDAVRFARLAQAIDREGLLPALRVQREQPLFPVCVWAVHGTITRVAGDFRSAWALSVQWAAATALVLAVVPIYFLSMRLWGAGGAVVGSLLFCVLPEVARLGADGLSDSTHLLFFALALWGVVEFLRVRGSGFRVQESGGDGDGAGASVAIRRTDRATDRADDELAPPAVGGRPAWLLAAGVATGLAALARAEVLVLPVALAVTLGWFQLRGRWRRPSLKLASAGGCFVLGAGLVLGPYLTAMGSLGPRAAADRLLGRYDAEQDAGRSPSQPATAPAGARAWQLADGRPMSFDVKDRSTSIRRRGYASAAVRFAHELADAFGYWIGLFAVFGLWGLGRRPAREVDGFLAVFFGLFSLAAIHFAATEGYLGARHLLVLVVAGIGAAGRGVVALGPKPPAASDEQPASPAPGQKLRELSALAAGLVVFLAVVTGYAVLVVGPLHASRAGHRQAAEWLAGQTTAPGMVIDTRGWTGLYSGRTTHPYTDAPAVLLDPRLAYVVVQKEELEFDSRRGRTLRTLLAAAGRRVAEFPEPHRLPSGWQSVVVYRWAPERFRRWVGRAAVVAEKPRSDRERAG